jgi:tight adherence protein B
VAAGAAAWSPVPLLAGAAAVPLVRRALRRRAERALAERVAAAVSSLCGTVAGDLRAGCPPNFALAEALQTDEWSGVPELAAPARPVLSAARFGGDVPSALRDAAGRCAGAHGLRAVAACWQVAVDGGAGLAAALDRVAGALRAEADQREDIRAQLAGPRSTAALLALLPAFGVVLGTGLGAGPVSVLLHTRTGLVCLGAGALLEWAGLAWTGQIARAAEGERHEAEYAEYADSSGTATDRVAAGVPHLAETVGAARAPDGPPFGLCQAERRGAVHDHGAGVPTAALVRDAGLLASHAPAAVVPEVRPAGALAGDGLGSLP